MKMMRKAFQGWPGRVHPSTDPEFQKKKKIEELQNKVSSLVDEIVKMLEVIKTVADTACGCPPDHRPDCIVGKAQGLLKEKKDVTSS